ncbi:MAG: hypothetical protein HKN17_10995 [Rhodothermales bacterium]|nr:hypothetical protein [Rhodothermales bacterium]
MLIVTSILLAFAIDAAWAERGRRQDQRRAIQALHQDFSAAAELLRQVAQDHRDGVLAGESLLRYTGPQAPSIEDDSIAAFIPPLIRIPYFSPSLGSLDALLSSGNLGVIESPELRMALAEFPVALAALNRTQEYGSRLVLGQFLPAISPYIPLRRYGMASRGATAFDGDVRALMTRLEFENLVQVRLMNHELALRATVALEERIMRLLDLLADD